MAQMCSMCVLRAFISGIAIIFLIDTATLKRA